MPPWTVHSRSCYVFTVSGCHSFVVLLSHADVRIFISLRKNTEQISIRFVEGNHYHRNWKSAQVVNFHLVCDPTIRQLGFDLPQQPSSLLNRFHTEQGLQKEMATYRNWSVSLWRDADLSHIVESCSLTKLNGDFSRLHSADEDAVFWLTNYGSWHAYEKKKKAITCRWTDYILGEIVTATRSRILRKIWISVNRLPRCKCGGIIWWHAVLSCLVFLSVV